MLPDRDIAALSGWDAMLTAIPRELGRWIDVETFERARQPESPPVRRTPDNTATLRKNAVPPFDVGGLIRRARRNAGVSQRELAAAIGVSQSTVMRAEQENATVSLPVLLAALTIGGIELIAVDEDGEVVTMRNDELRDRSNRRAPAHLQARVARAHEYVPSYWPCSIRRNAPLRWKLRSGSAASYDLTLYQPGPEAVAIASERDAMVETFRVAQRDAWHSRAPDRHLRPSVTEIGGAAGSSSPRRPS